MRKTDFKNYLIAIMVAIALLANTPGFAQDQKFTSTETALGHTVNDWAFMTAWDLTSDDLSASPAWFDGYYIWDFNQPHRGHWIAKLIYQQDSGQTRQLQWSYTQAHVQYPPPFVLIPAGSFMMGNATNVFSPLYEGTLDELPQHSVYVSDFYLETHEVTEGLWDEVVSFNGGNGYTYSNSAVNGKGAEYPAGGATWYDVVKWCNARSEMDGLTPVYYSDEAFTLVYKTGEIIPYVNWTNNGYRLPTEAEWEKAARGGVPNHRFPWTDVDTIDRSRANYYANQLFSYDTSPTDGYHPDFYTGEGNKPYTAPVGSFPATGYGLYDMAGNVFEWCWDLFHHQYYSGSPASNPRGPASSYHESRESGRVLRGGAWAPSLGYGPNEARVSHRFAIAPYLPIIQFAPQLDLDYRYFGFRCARSP